MTSDPQGDCSSAATIHQEGLHNRSRVDQQTLDDFERRRVPDFEEQYVAYDLSAP